MTIHGTGEQPIVSGSGGGEGPKIPSKGAAPEKVTAKSIPPDDLTKLHTMRAAYKENQVNWFSAGWTKLVGTDAEKEELTEKQTAAATGKKSFNAELGRIAQEAGVNPEGLRKLVKQSSFDIAFAHRETVRDNSKALEKVSPEEIADRFDGNKPLDEAYDKMQADCDAVNNLLEPDAIDKDRLKIARQLGGSADITHVESDIVAKKTPEKVAAYKIAIAEADKSIRNFEELLKEYRKKT